MEDNDALVERYQMYLAACNERRWDEVERFVGAHVLVNGHIVSRAEYISGIKATISVFPDYQWQLRRLMREQDWLAVHLRDTGTRRREYLGAPGDCSVVETDEFNMYRIADGLIVELEGTADNARLTR